MLGSMQVKVRPNGPKRLSREDSILTSPKILAGCFENGYFEEAPTLGRAFEDSADACLVAVDRIVVFLVLLMAFAIGGFRAALAACCGGTTAALEALWCMMVQGVNSLVRLSTHGYQVCFTASV